MLRTVLNNLNNSRAFIVFGLFTNGLVHRPSFELKKHLIDFNGFRQFSQSKFNQKVSFSSPKVRLALANVEISRLEICKHRIFNFFFSGNVFQ